MKLLKRILAIVCTFVMIISMATGVNAVNDTSTTATAAPTKGSITLENVVVGDTYNVYKILSLESYIKDKAYSYKKTDDKWADFVVNGKGADFLTTNSDGYVKFKDNANNDNAARMLAIYAIGFAQANRETVKPTKTVRAEATSKTTKTSVVFDDLDLGYYVVESTSGTACAITTTDPHATIKNKQDNPSVNKTILDGHGVVSANNKMNSVNIGDTVGFKTTIHVKPGAKNYVLHDIMDKNLDFNFVAYVYYINKNNKQVHLTEQANDTANPHFVVTRSELGDNCTFELKFTNYFYSTYKEAIDAKEITEIYVEYVATVKDTAPIDTAMKNTTYLTYGENNLETDKSETKTYTYGIPVYKYTGNNTPLAGAKFILSKAENPDETNAIKFTQAGGNYTYAANQKSGAATTTLESDTKGNIQIKGLEAGTYYLKETEAPKGYNKISSPIKIVVEANEDTGKPVIKVDKNGNATVVTRVEVQNNTGSVLPSTGGMGTTLIYVVGSILVLASGIVLFSKRKEGTN